MASSTLKTYYYLTKPGIVYGNAVTAAAGFLLASGYKRTFHIWLLAGLLVGISLVIAAACVTNNYIDRHIDRNMARTKKRALATGKITGKQAFPYALLLGIAGFACLIAFTNALTVALGIIAFVDYVVLYGIAKRKSVHGTIVGSISGALPPVAGYTAVTNRFDVGAVIIFLMLVCWQMPHFYAIAIYRLKDYAAAGLPVLPVKRSIHAAKVQIIGYIAAFVVAASLLTFFGYTGVIYLIVMLALGLWWLWRALQGLHTKDDTLWAKKLFLVSLVVTLGMSAMLSLGALLP